MKEKTTIKEKLTDIKNGLTKIKNEISEAEKKYNNTKEYGKFHTLEQQEFLKVISFLNFEKNQESIDELIENAKTIIFHLKKKIISKKEEKLNNEENSDTKKERVEKEYIEHKQNYAEHMEIVQILEEILTVLKYSNVNVHVHFEKEPKENLKNLEKNSILLENLTFKIKSILDYDRHEYKYYFSGLNNEGIKYIHYKSFQLMQTDTFYNLEELIENIQNKSQHYFIQENKFEDFWNKMNTLMLFEKNITQKKPTSSYIDDVGNEYSMMVLYSQFLKTYNDNIDKIETPKDFFYYTMQSKTKENLEYLNLSKHSMLESLTNPFKTFHENLKQKNIHKIFDYFYEEIYKPLLSSYCEKKEPIFNGFFLTASKSYNMAGEQVEITKKLMSEKDVKKSIAHFFIHGNENQWNYFYDINNCSEYFVSIVNELWETDKKTWFDLINKLNKIKDNNSKDFIEFHSPGISSQEFKENQEKRMEKYLLTEFASEQKKHKDTKIIRF